MAKIIVLSGHGSWEMKDGYTQLPARTSIKFYTCNMKTLSDGLGGDIDRGIVANLEPDQESGPYSTVPNMRLYPPHGLNIRTPNANTWNVIDIPTSTVPTSNKNLQVRIDHHYGGGGDLKTLLELLQPALVGHEVTILWAACRAIGLHNAGGKYVGVNAMQR
jgi:hypothetical protein